MLRQTLDKTWTLCHSGWASISQSQILDIDWTDIGLDRLWTKPRFNGPPLAQTQTLDIVWTIMGYGQTLVCLTVVPYSESIHSPPMDHFWPTYIPAMAHLQPTYNLLLAHLRPTYGQQAVGPRSAALRSAELGPASLARSARSQTIGRFAPS